MIDLDTFRARVGKYDSKNYVGHRNRSKLKCCRETVKQCGKVVGVLAVASVILIMIVFVDVSYGDWAERDCFYSGVQGLPKLGNFLPFLRGPIRAQNYRFYNNELERLHES